MDITILIPFYNGNQYLSTLLSSIPQDWPTIVINDRSDEAPKTDRNNVTILNLNKKGYFTGAVNAGIQACETDVLILNQDVLFADRRAFDLIRKERESYAMIGERIKGNHPAWPMGYIHGTFMFVRRDAINAVGLMDEKNYPLWGSTCEWQLRACRKGYKVLPFRPIPGMKHQRKGNYGSSIAELLRKEPENRGLFIRTPPLISVIVPTYNHGKFLPELIASLIGGRTAEGYTTGQTLQSFEVIIADDCSEDNTAEIAKAIADPWQGIHYVRTAENSGTSVACNTAIKKANANIIARIDGDDMREPFALEAMYELQKDNMDSFVYDDCVLLTPNGRSSKVWRMEEYDYNKLIYKNTIHAGLMFPKKAWKDVGGYPEEMRWGRDDWAFNVALGLHGWCGVHCKRPGYIYRRHGQNRTLTNTTPRQRKAFLQQIQKLFPQAYSQERPMGCCGGRSAPRSQTNPTNGGGTYTMPTEGASGMIILEYQGDNYGKETYYGPVTGTAYTFSAKHNRRLVDRRDLRYSTPGGHDVGLLDLVDRGKDVFKVVREESKPAPEPVPEPAPEPTPVLEEVEEVEEVTELDAIYVEELTAIRGVGQKSAEALVEAGYLNAEHILEASMEKLSEDLGWPTSRANSLLEAVKEYVGE